MTELGLPEAEPYKKVQLFFGGVGGRYLKQGAEIEKPLCNA